MKIVWSVFAKPGSLITVGYNETNCGIFLRNSLELSEEIVIKITIKTKGGGVMILVPKHLYLKERIDPNQMDPNCLESLWIECNLPGCG